jgi:site-specific DNA-cytosine methylase
MTPSQDIQLQPQREGVIRSGAWLGRVLVACEYSGSVRDAFAKLGWDAWSCDLLPTDKPGQHFQGDVRDILREGWDIMVAHPPCTHLAVSGARWFPAKRASGEQQAALNFVRLLLEAPIPHIALENPVSIISSKIRKPDQVIQPWQHGHGETKATCLWLKNLPRLTPTNIVAGREQRIWKLPPSADRWKERSRTFSGVAEAMANQWTLATRPNNRGVPMPTDNHKSQ